MNLRAKQSARLAQLGGAGEQWHPEAWGFYDTNPEAGAAVQYTGNQLAKVRLFPAVRPVDDPDAEPIPADDEESQLPPQIAQAAKEHLARLRSPLGGQGEILRALAMNLEVPGEGYLVVVGQRERTDEEMERLRQEGEADPARIVPERAEVLSTDEVEVRGRQTLVRLDGNPSGVPLDPNLGDSITRIWQRHPRWSTKADSAFRHCLPIFRTLASLTARVNASTNSQMHAGILAMPSTMTHAGTSVTPASNSEHEQSPFEEALDESFTVPIEDPDDLLTVRPMVVFGTTEEIAAMQHLTFGRDVDDGLDDRIEKNVLRLARGLNLPVEVVTGLMMTTFANASQIDRATFDDYLEPRCRLMADGITVGFLRAELHADPRQFDPVQIDRVLCWYDPSELFGHPDQAGAATEGVKIGAIGRHAWRNTYGYSDADAMEEGEEPPAAAPMPGQNPGASPAPVEAEPVEEEQPVAAAAKGARGKPLGARLTEIDQRLQDRLTAAFSLAIDRALERAGARLKSRAAAAGHRDLVAAAAPKDVARLLGPALTADVSDEDDLLAGAWTTVEPLYRNQVTSAQSQARNAASRRVPIGDVAAQQAEDLDDAWAWTEAELTATTKRSMFADLADATLGEANPSMRAPGGLVRQSLARAGGQRGIEPRGEAQGYVTTLAGTDLPAGGVATGTTMMEALTDAGAQVTGFTWIYGDSERPFEPHVELDGLTFDSYDDPDLTNSDVWPPFPHYFPGDHNGCTCAAEPTVLGPDDIGL